MAAGARDLALPSGAGADRVRLERLSARDSTGRQQPCSLDAVPPPLKRLSPFHSALPEIIPHLPVTNVVQGQAAAACFQGLLSLLWSLQGLPLVPPPSYFSLHVKPYSNKQAGKAIFHELQWLLGEVSMGQSLMQIGNCLLPSVKQPRQPHGPTWAATSLQGKSQQGHHNLKPSPGPHQMFPSR